MDRLVMDGVWILGFLGGERDVWYGMVWYGMVWYVGLWLWDCLFAAFVRDGDVVKGAGWKERGGLCLCGSLNYSHSIFQFLWRTQV
jgi:hypothetical protein